MLCTLALIAITGCAQGVGFRYAASSYGCTEWVNNEWDGSVTMEIQGNPDDIDRVIQTIRAGRYVAIEKMDGEDIGLG